MQQCAAGLVPVRRTADGLAFAIARGPDGMIWVGGGTVTCVSGQVEL